MHEFEQYKPVVRWWLPGYVTDMESCKKQLDTIKECGLFGSVEVQIFCIN